MKANYPGILGVLGGVLDVVVGSVLLQRGMMATQVEPTMMGGAMGSGSVTNLGAGTLLIALGLIVLVTGLYSFGSQSMPRMRKIGGLMLAYGILMIFVGLSMFYGLGMVMQAGFVSGSLMLIVGVLMILSGSSMLRRQPMM